VFDHLTGRLTSVFDRLRGKKTLQEEDMTEVLREIRVALLEADVALPIVREFMAKVKEKATGQDIMRSVTADQQIVKIVFDEMKSLLGAKEGEFEGLHLEGHKPAIILMVGLQGSGKTTTTGKLGLRLKKRQNKTVLMASLDTRRPAAQEQLRLLGEQVEVDTLPIVQGETALEITQRALEVARHGVYDVLLLDTAGRMVLDEELMAEVVDIKTMVQPHEVILVADSLTGQDSLQVAKAFHEKVGVTGIALTRMDGDGRGGAALSMRAATGCPVKLLGVGERLDQLEDFDAHRVANRILGMGDIVALVERAAETIKIEDAQNMMNRMFSGQFDYNDMLTQMNQMKNMGGFGGIMGLLPGISRIKQQLDEANLDQTVVKKQRLIIQSMTKQERANPALIEGATSRRRRIAKGANASIEDVNSLIKSHNSMGEMMKMMSGMASGDTKGLKGLMGGLGGGFSGMKNLMKGLMGKGMPSPEEMQKMMGDLSKDGNLPPELLANMPKDFDMSKMAELFGEDGVSNPSSSGGSGFARGKLPEGVSPFGKGRFKG
jgi:signal recognition particle subunit SRP54